MLPAEFTARMQRLLGGEFDAFAACYDAPRHTAAQSAEDRRAARFVALWAFARAVGEGRILL